MAIDTKQKRFSMLNFSSINDLLFEVDGTVDADDMYQMIDIYSGITLDAPPSGPTSNPLIYRNKKSFLNRQGPF